MNALCCCRQILPWPKVLTNYFDDNWLCTINFAPRLDWPILFAHPSKGGKLTQTYARVLIAKLKDDEETHWKVGHGDKKEPQPKTIQVLL